MDSIRRALAPWLIALTIMCALANAVAIAGRWHWLADLFVHFVPQYFLAGVVLFVALIWTKRYSWAAVALLITLWNGWLLSPYLLPRTAPAPRDGVSLDVLQFNVSRDNLAPLATLGYILSLERKPDVIVLFEVTPAFAAELKRIKDLYPTLAQMPRQDNFGMAILSRLEESEVEFREIGEPGLPLMVLRTRVGGDRLRIYAVHPPPPLSGALARARNAQLQELAAEISARPGDRIVITGDLNTTVWSHALKPLIDTASLRDAQRGRGYLPTWAPPPYARWIGVSLDLTLVSDGIGVEQRIVGPWLGSDHWPVHTTLWLR